MRRAFISRWYVTLLGLLLTAALGVGAVMYVPAQYQAKSVSLLYPPGTKLAENPLTNLSSLTGLPDVLNQTLTAPAAVAKIKAAGEVGTYTVTNDLSTTGPLVVVTALSKTPAQAKHLATYVTNLIPAKLRELQTEAGISIANNFIKSTPINPVDKTTVVRKDQTRAMLLAVAVGLLLTVLLVAAAERFAMRRARTAKRPQPPLRRAPQPYASRANAKAPAHMIHPMPDATNGARKSASAKSASRRRARRAKDDVEAGHEPVTTSS